MDCFGHLGAVEQAVNTTLTYYHLSQVDMANMLANSFLITHPAVTKQHR